MDLAQSAYHQISDTRSSIDDLGAGQRRGHRSSLSSVVLHCTVSVGLAAAALCLLSALGLAASAQRDPDPAWEGPVGRGGYSTDDVWKDMRSIVSFVLGALLTSCVGGDFSQAGDDLEEPEEQPSKIMERLIFFTTFM
ncbi:unnamed protein product [Prorocentrum cordatum]|uniref:PGG domain-containing protein n=1 Tax=Prorocentrum cordatum TaxID=2364126 RepID=A0ABN9PP57_9DINO|nr:unnamed protein product [Polarella glacialis]|mmetsp:Transcript_14218/g.37800  ORF Transcript_14218/g.37800 Transcript_14218/m.37800 type:complete len:138 (+) Transcript_14218:72-485(+)